MYSQQEALKSLLDHTPVDSDQQEVKQFIVEFVRNNPAYWSRANLAGHLTGSAWITDVRRERAVLLHHKKLAKWLQPGGHIDADDADLAQASLREAREETGLVNLTLAQPGIFDLDVHRIPARASEREHWHLDVRFWFISADESLVLSHESNALSWLSRSEIIQLTEEESVLRMVRKSLVTQPISV